jgi:hypothetical protein
MTGGGGAGSGSGSGWGRRKRGSRTRSGGSFRSIRGLEPVQWTRATLGWRVRLRTSTSLMSSSPVHAPPPSAGGLRGGERPVVDGDLVDGADELAEREVRAVPADLQRLAAVAERAGDEQRGRGFDAVEVEPHDGAVVRADEVVAAGGDRVRRVEDGVRPVDVGFHDPPADGSAVGGAVGGQAVVGTCRWRGRSGRPPSCRSSPRAASSPGRCWCRGSCPRTSGRPGRRA